jgi:hypothetical protein
MALLPIRLLASAVAACVIAVAIGGAVSSVFLFIIPSSFWGEVNHLLFRAYSLVGLTGIPFRFSWSWMTVFFISKILPCTVSAYVVWVLLIRQQGSGGLPALSETLMLVGSNIGCGVVFLVVMRIGLTGVLAKWLAGQFPPPDEAARVGGLLWCIVVFGIPSAVLVILLRQMLVVLYYLSRSEFGASDR